MKSDIQPFRMYGNLYFVGSSKVSVHVIKTEVGLVMIDTGYPNMYEQIIESITEVGLDPKDICAIFHSHGHSDHIGCTCRFKALSGAKTYISRIDNEIVNGTRDLTLGALCEEPFNCDVLIDDGDTFTFGTTTVRCRLAPGHTEGTLAFFVNIEENGNRVIAGMHGGLGLNTLKRAWLQNNGFTLAMRDVYRNTLHKLASEMVDIVMGNHPGQNNTVRKLEKVLAEESVLDASQWLTLLQTYEEKLDKLQADEAAQ